jgi:hypothetical protein
MLVSDLGHRSRRSAAMRRARFAVGGSHEPLRETGDEIAARA